MLCQEPNAVFLFIYFHTCILVLALSTHAQQFRTPRPSPNATVTQTVGVTDITIDYSCPGSERKKNLGRFSSLR